MTGPPAGQAAQGQVLKPANDKAEYRVVCLHNGLRVLLIHDADADKSAAALAVRVGSLSDPDELPGLAHFCEHMLFYSSEKYPVEDEYSKFISDHGGHTNAFTAAEETNYQFDVNPDAFAEALDRFAQFFICPLISADGVDREVQAVDSEHAKNLQADAWRLHQLHKATANTKHPWGRFATGNLDTLLTQPTAAGIDVRAAVAEFHAKHYSANLMTACVISRHSLDELQALVAGALGPVPSHPGLAAPSFPPDVHLNKHRGLLVRVVPVRESHSLELTWDIPPTDALYREAPTNYLSHLLGHEGAGSAFALLKARGLATALSAGEGSGISSRAFFAVRVELTEEGNARVAEVAEVIFKYLDLMRAPGGISDQIYRELSGLQELRFNWRDKMPPFSVVTSLAGAMHHFPDRDLLLALYHVPQVYDPACIASFLAELTPARARLTWASRAHEAADGGGSPAGGGGGGELQACELQAEAVYGTRHAVSRIPGAWLASWTDGVALPGLHLPSANPFVPGDLSLKASPGGEGLPRLLLDTPQLRLWQRTDLRFEAPKANIVLDLQSPAAYASPEAAVCTRLLVKLLADYLNEIVYPAELAGLSYGVSNHQAGLQISVAGYSEKLPLLLDLLLDELAGFTVKPDRFAVVREAARREYRNIRFQQPYQWCMYRSELLVQHRRWRVDEYLHIVERVTPDSLTAFLPRLLARLGVEALALGNLSADEAAAIATSALAKLQRAWGAAALWPGEEKELRVVKLPPAAASVFVEDGPNPANENSAVWLCYQVGPDELRRNALAALTVQLSKREAFNQLRTQQQLGYIVHMYGTVDQGVQGIAFIVQSDKFSAAELALRVERFVRSQVQRLAALSEEEFAAGVAELCKAKLEKPKRLSELASRWWGEVFAGTHVFDRQQREVDELRSLTAPELAAFAVDVLGPGPSRRKLAVLIRGSGELGSSSSSSSSTSATQAQAAGVGATEAAEPACPAGGAGSGSRAGACSAAGGPHAAAPGGSWQELLAYAAGAVPEGEAFMLVPDAAAFKRGCEVWPLPGERHGASHGRAAGGMLGAGAGAAAAPAGSGDAAAAAAAQQDGPSAAKL